MELVAALVRIQQNARLSDAAFAETIGVPRTTWNGYKRGYPISLGFVQKAVAAYPQVRGNADRLIAARSSDKSSKRGRNRNTRVRATA